MEKDDIFSPYDGAIVGQMPVSTAADVEAMIQTAEAAFDTMRRLPRFVRADILDKASRLLRERKEAFAELISREAGKPLYDARGEVARSIFNLSNAAAEARRFGGKEVPLDMDAGVFEYQTTDEQGQPIALDALDNEGMARIRRRIGIARRFPIGPILAIAPFNFPLNLLLHKVAPALAVGNSVVVKPAPQTPLTALKLQELLRDAGLPEGAIQICHCPVPLAEHMVKDERFAMVTFTGSAAVGWHIKSIAGRKKVALELGGNGAVIIAPDADLDLAATRCVRGGVVYGGQYCIGVQRILVHESVQAAFTAKLLQKIKACKIGDPLLEDTDVGPVIDINSARRIEQWIDEAVSAGATMLAGGPRQDAIIMPTVLSNTSSDMKVEKEEIFGPVLTVNTYSDFDDAVRRCADSRYGLQGGIFTNDLQHAFQAIEEWPVGGLMINDVPIYRIDNMPFGGWKDSGTGREGTSYAMEEMSDIRFLVINYA